MTTISINKNAALINGVDIGEVLLLLVIHNEINLQEAEDALIKKGFITSERDDSFIPIGWRLTNKGSEVLDSVIIDSTPDKEFPDELEALAVKLKEIFPKGKKEGTNYYWTEGVAIIVRRLKTFFKKYGNNFSEKQILQATKKYVESFNGDYQYMRLLKYFIFREKTGAGKDVEGDSELINYIENAGQEDTLNDNWQVTIR